MALCEGNSPVTGGFPSQRPVTGSFDFFFICAWTNGWACNRDAGYLRRHRPHDVTVMSFDKEAEAAKRVEFLDVLVAPVLSWDTPANQSITNCPILCKCHQTFRTTRHMVSWLFIASKKIFGRHIVIIAIIIVTRFILFLSPWRGAWRHQAITRTNVDLPSVGYCIIYLKLIALEMLMDIIINACKNYNSLRPRDAYMRRQPRPSLVQVMACRLFGAKPYCSLD